jgi:hypothetical protein
MVHKVLIPFTHAAHVNHIDMPFPNIVHNKDFP